MKHVNSLKKNKTVISLIRRLFFICACTFLHMFMTRIKSSKIQNLHDKYGVIDIPLRNVIYKREGERSSVKLPCCSTVYSSQNPSQIAEETSCTTPVQIGLVCNQPFAITCTHHSTPEYPIRILCKPMVISS